MLGVTFVRFLESSMRKLVCFVCFVKKKKSLRKQLHGSVTKSPSSRARLAGYTVYAKLS